MIGLIAITAAGRASAAQLAAAWPGETRNYDGPAQAGAAPGLGRVRRTGVLPRRGRDHPAGRPAAGQQVDRPGRGLRGRDRPGTRWPWSAGTRPGANALCARVAEVLGAQPIITTATDATGLPGLDTLGWPAEGAVAAVSRALLDGESGRASKPTSPGHSRLPGHGRRRLPEYPDRGHRPRSCPIDENTVVLRPPSLVAWAWARAGGHRGGGARPDRRGAGRGRAVAGARWPRWPRSTPRPGRTASSAAARAGGWPLATLPGRPAGRRPGAEPERGGPAPPWARRAWPRRRR